MKYSNLLKPNAVEALDCSFIRWLKQHDSKLSELLHQYRTVAYEDATSSHLIAIAEAASIFLAEHLGLDAELAKVNAQHRALAPIWRAKARYIQKYLSHLPSPVSSAEIDNVETYFSKHYGLPLTELNLAIVINKHLESEAPDALPEKVRDFCLSVLHKLPGTELHQSWQLFRLPQPLDYEQLMETEDVKLEPRRGFEFIGDNSNLNHAQSHAHYCIYCHKREKDTCRTGMHRAEVVKQNPLGNKLTGCPLEQRISEMNLLKAEGNSLAALIMLMRDNPLAILTGHRICNDCSKACIFQKQEPVDIPYVESQIVQEVLAMDYGFELYHLLTQWQPLNFASPVPAHDSGRKILIVGTGPAGIALSYYLLRAGHQVVAIDGMKIPPLPREVIRAPVEDFFATAERHDQAAFGGVAAYGITARWDKRLLLAARLILERSQAFALFGGVRFGSNITEAQAWEMGFDHIGLALGAGKQVLLDIPGNLAAGVRMAADFLMTLHLAKPYRGNSLGALPLKLPALVIGGGLTAIDAATEAAAYYPELVLNFAARILELGGAEWLERLDRKNYELAKLWLSHAEVYKGELQAANAEEREPNFSAITSKLGGVKLIYHRELNKAASYKLNHHEIAEAVKQGVEVVTILSTQEIVTNHDGEVESLRLLDSYGREHLLPAASVLIAIGTKTSEVPYKGERVTVVGDADPKYYGSVVKAIASSKAAAPKIDRYLRQNSPASNLTSQEFKQLCQHNFTATIVSLKQISESKFTLKIEAPMAAQNYRDGMYYKLENLHPIEGKYILEPLAIMPVSVSGSVLKFEVSICGASTMLASRLQPGEQVSLTGPLGTSRPPETSATIVPASLQCMMQGICAHCLQRKLDPSTGKYSYFYTCAEQWQNEQEVDQKFLSKRASQNKLLETVNLNWLGVKLTPRR